MLALVRGKLGFDNLGLDNLGLDNLGFDNVGFDKLSSHANYLTDGTSYSLLCIERVGESMGAKHTVLPDCQPPTTAFTVLAQLGDQTANGAEMALLTRNDEGRDCDFF